MQKVNITFKGTIEQDDKEMLEDMIKIAINNAVKKVDQEIEDKMGAYGSSLNGLF